MYTKCNDLTMPQLSRAIKQAAVDLVNDNEQNHYILCHLMQRLNIDTTSESAYSNLYLYLIETIDQLIDDIPAGDEYFSPEASNMIDNIDTVIQCIESFAGMSYDSYMFLYNRPYATI